MTDLASDEAQRRAAERRFRTDVRAHIKDIAERYIVPGETSDGAIMFIPAEAVFAEIQAHQPEVVQEAHRARVWMASPTTLVAILNTARAVLKDDATRKQMHVIRRHLAELARDFDRFRERMDRLAAHMDQANRDVQQVHTSARKLSARFDVIEKVELEGEPLPDGETLPEGAADARANEATGSG
jgi:DNA recombination protein RmuC